MSAVPSPLRCEVVGTGKLSNPATDAAICDAIRSELSARSLDVRAVTVRVESARRLAVAVVLPGDRSLPLMHFARTDAALSRGAIRRLAAAVADHAANAGAGR